MRRRDFLTATTVAGITAAAQAVKGDTVIPNEQDQTLNMANPERRRYVLVETYATQSVQKRDDLLLAFDSQLIADRNKLGFDKVGVFYVDTDLMSSDRSYDAKFFDSFFLLSKKRFFGTVSRPSTPHSGQLFASIFRRSSICRRRNDPLAFSCRMALLFLILTRIGFYNFAYNSPNYERNFAKARMFDRRSTCSDVVEWRLFLWELLFGTWIPNITYMLSFENDKQDEMVGICLFVILNGVK